MTIRKILAYPDPVLRVPAVPVTKFNEDLSQLVVDMAETMYDAPGIGLAAPQIGESIQLILVDVSREEDEQKFMVMINPEIIEHEGKQDDEEGCLSVLELTAMVQRYQKVTVRYQDIAGKEQELNAEDRFAVVLQHEIDHLNGVLFIDHLSSLKRSLYKKKVKKMLAADQRG
ncbi:MAG: peptide deformylase [Desulfobulbaceae bacterium]|uniref:Peptide deformylase n=1 Tax=Candidatus Desulfatifera sulfidica TaxID=2841691 RepID=A0A8J6N765_9BACT|nr:peptide deformylase [Candidatus Desulfatifera sulfidica]